VFLALFCHISVTILSPKLKAKKRLNHLSEAKIAACISTDIIDIHDYARTGSKLDGLSNIVVHYVGNPATSAKNNRDYFNSEGVNVSSHFIVGLEGEVIQCLPLEEISAASNHRNHDTISIEVCHPDQSGKFSEKTYDALLELLSWLCFEFDLETEAIIRHYDVTGKECPLYYVLNPEEWEELLSDVDLKLSNYQEGTN